ncbi:MAG TPA: TonB-dependent receptor, partial [Usitatibacter sp.]|nr:TonB-dependent receptor [Usitatibacter sp.]
MGAVLALAGAPAVASELFDLSLEELAAMPVTSVFRRAEAVSAAPASIYVISADDIRRSGAATLAEALRLAPNLQVARVDARGYAISARGFNNAIGNKLLVMVDGRTVYSPLFSGVFWDQQDAMLEDVERIEVVSGPGATQWGANAVNGVINVITRNARDTRGALVAGTAGRTEDGAVARVGTALAGGDLRLYGKSIDHAGTRRADGTPVGDAWRRWQAGFRADWSGPVHAFTLVGEAYDGEAKAGTVLGTPSFSGASLLGRWTRSAADGSELRVQAYVDQAERDDVVLFRDRMRVHDLEAQYLTTLGGHQVMVGAGYRYARDRTERTPLVVFMPAERDLRWSNLFVQDTVQLAPDWRVAVGVKLERNVYTGLELLPSLRLAWTKSPRELVWGAVLRAVRAPARLDREFFLPGSPPFAINGGPDFESEVVN